MPVVVKLILAESTLLAPSVAENGVDRAVAAWLADTSLNVEAVRALAYAGAARIVTGNRTLAEQVVVVPSAVPPPTAIAPAVIAASLIEYVYRCCNAVSTSCPRRSNATQGTAVQLYPAVALANPALAGFLVS